MRCVVFAGGPAENYDVVRVGPGDVVICADGGARHAAALGIVPQLIIGDMDSVDPGLLDDLERKGSRVEKHPREKDELDGELAIHAAISTGAGEIVVYGGTGGRLDHALANIHLLAVPAGRGIRAVMEDSRHRISVATPALPAVVEGRGAAFSLLPLTTRVEGVTSRGTAWDLDGAVFEIGKPYGVSNVVVADRARISVGQGMLLVVELTAGPDFP